MPHPDRQPKRSLKMTLLTGSMKTGGRVLKKLVRQINDLAHHFIGQRSAWDEGIPG